MTTAGAFASLFQLAAGVGLGVSVFWTPVELRLRRLRQRVQNDLLLTPAEANDDNRRRRNAILVFNTSLDVADKEVGDSIKVPSYLITVGVVVNLALLIWATLKPDETLSFPVALLMLGLSLGWFVLSLLWIEIVASSKLSSLSAQYEHVRTST